MASEIRSSLSKEAVLSKAMLNASEHLGLSHTELARLLGISDTTMSQLAAFECLLTPDSAEGQRALMLIQTFRALDALVGGETAARITWMNSYNESIGDIPKLAVQTLSGLELTLAYLNSMVIAINAGEALRPR